MCTAYGTSLLPQCPLFCLFFPPPPILFSPTFFCYGHLILHSLGLGRAQHGEGTPSRDPPPHLPIFSQAATSKFPCPSPAFMPPRQATRELAVISEPSQHLADSSRHESVGRGGRWRWGWGQKETFQVASSEAALHVSSPALIHAWEGQLGVGMDLRVPGCLAVTRKCWMGGSSFTLRPG